MESIQRTCLRVLLTFVVGGAAVHVVVMALGRDGALHGFANSRLYYAILIAAAIACLWRAVAVSRDRLAWILIGLGVACWAGGDLHWTLVYSDDAKAPYPSLTDALYLLYYPLVAAGVLALAVAGARRLRGTVLLDGAIAGIGAAAIGAALLGPAIAGYSRRDPIAALVDAAYPVGDMVILGGVAAAAVVLGWRRDFALLALGLLAMTAADIAYLYAAATTGYVEGGITDSGWVVAAALTALAAWQPRGRPRELASDARAIALPGLFAVAAIALLVADHFDRLPEVAVWLAAATLGLAVARLVLAFAENAGLLAAARDEATTDALTGIGNRRALVDDLERAAAAAGRGRGEYVLAIFDLDGFKGYNDTFGHARRRPAPAAARRRARRGDGDPGARLPARRRRVLRPRPAAGGGEARADRRRGRGGAARGRRGLHDHLLAGAMRGSRRRRGRRPMRCGSPTGACTPTRAPRRARSSRRPASCCSASCASRSPSSASTSRGSASSPAGSPAAASSTVEDVDVIGRAAELHDIGKMAIPDEILSKSGPLTDDEWDADAHPHPDRRADAECRARSRPRRPARPLEPRAVRRQRLSRRARGRADPDRRPDHRDLRRLRGDARAAARTASP